MTRRRMLWAGIVLAMLLTSALCWAQTGRFSVQFDATPLSRVLDALKRFDANLQFSLSPDLGERKVTASLVDVTVDEALQVVLGQANLVSVKDNGVYMIREKPNAAGGRIDRPAPRLPAPVFQMRPTAPGEGTGAAAGGAATPAGGGKAATGTEQKTPPLRLIIIKYADPADIAYLFGGSVIEGNSSGSGGSGSSGGGGDGSNNGNSNNNNSSGSSRGNRSSNSSNSSGSSRSSRSSRSSNN